MIPGQWYGDRVADDVRPWPAEWSRSHFRQTLRKLRELGFIEKRMRTYEYGATAFNVRVPTPNGPVSNAAGTTPDRE